MTDTEKLDLILGEVQASRNDLKEFKAETSHTLRVIEKRLSLIENRLSNMEPFISVDNTHLVYKA